MTTTIYTEHDSPEHMQSRRLFEALPSQAQRRIHVLSNAVRISETLPDPIVYSDETTNTAVNPSLSADSEITTSYTPDVVKQNTPTTSEPFLAEAYRMLSDVWRNN